MVGGSVNMGDGVYKSTDAGKTWRHIGLDETEHIGNMWVDPHNPDIVLVAALGRTYSKNAAARRLQNHRRRQDLAQGSYIRTTSPARSIWFSRPAIRRSATPALWEHYTAPGGRAAIESAGFAGVYQDHRRRRHLDATHRRLAHRTPGPHRRGYFLQMDKKFSRSSPVPVDSAAADAAPPVDSTAPTMAARTGAKSTHDPRIQGSGYFSRVFLDPKNSDVVYVAQTSLYRSDDGGRTFDSYKGAPGGDDNHALWIDPTDSSRMMMASDQGGTISMDGGKSWSSLVQPAHRPDLSSRPPTIATRIGSTARSRTAVPSAP